MPLQPAKFAPPCAPRPIGFLAGYAPLLLLDMSGTMHPSKGGRFFDMKVSLPPLPCQPERDGVSPPLLLLALPLFDTWFYCMFCPSELPSFVTFYLPICLLSLLPSFLLSFFPVFASPGQTSRCVQSKSVVPRLFRPLARSLMGNNSHATSAALFVDGPSPAEVRSGVAEPSRRGGSSGVWL